MPRLIVYNTEYGAGLLGNPLGYTKFWRILAPPKLQNTKIAEALKEYNPDILGLVEIDLGSLRYKHINQTNVFKQILGLKYSSQRVKYSKKGAFRLFHEVPILKKQGNCILSKHKISETHFPELKNGTKRVVISSKIALDGKHIRVLLVHLSLGFKGRSHQLEQLIDLINTIKEPVILMGDFNTFHGRHELKELLDATKLEHKFTSGKHRQHYTQPSEKPKMMLDFILTSKQIKVTNYQVLPLELSDHRPVMIDFSLK